MAKVCNAITAVLIAALAMLVLLMVGPRLFGASTVSVLTASMEPNIPVGSLLIVNEKASVEDLVPGDVITFTLGSAWATHRLMEIKQDDGFLITKGDANPTIDGDVSMDRFVGKVVLGIPKLGQMSTMLQTKAAIPIIGIFVVVMILLIFLPEIFKKESA